MTDPYDVCFVESFELDLLIPPEKVARAAIEAASRLAENPRPPQCRKLCGTDTGYRIRVEGHDVFYSVNDEARSITVYHLVHFRESTAPAA